MRGHEMVRRCGASNTREIDLFPRGYRQWFEFVKKLQFIPKHVPGTLELTCSLLSEKIVQSMLYTTFHILRPPSPLSEKVLNACLSKRRGICSKRPHVTAAWVARAAVGLETGVTDERLAELLPFIIKIVLKQNPLSEMGGMELKPDRWRTVSSLLCSKVKINMATLHCTALLYSSYGSQ